MNEKDYYAILGVEQDSTTEQIRRAFQQKARKLHPDVNKEPDAEERFKEVSEAYAVLSDEGKRRRYDAMRSGNPFASADYGGTPGASPDGYGGFPFGWGFPFSDVAQRGRGGQRSRSYNPRVGADVTVRLDLDDESARKGVRRGVTYQRYVACDVCHGQGSVRSDHAETCPTCGGSGHMSVDLTGIFGFGVMEMECPECEGTGRVVSDPCHNCGGSGRVLSASEVVVEVPAGSHDGDEVRVPGMGNAGTNGQASGDFVCRVGVASERLSQRQASGFHSLGLAVPFLVLGALTNTLGSVALVIVTLVGVGAFLAFGEGLAHARGWWRSGLRSLANGASSGVVFALFLVMMFSCGSGLGSAGYRG
ncbi:DnaJ domain-containing protein [Olsenella sp. oral taxon 809]|uniref:DnaJ domain-containing protein n=1 Tax=Olsenella sp. oral taxon 809 TaxID=661086 RepID=UPI000231F1F5|nr:hypothetical protein HMPREF1008_01491 [Olsenella sp. oral taxon 809 str. F0356]